MVFNRPRMMIGGMVQSGGMMQKIWARAIGRLALENRQISRALIIGLGCGDCAFEIREHFPQAKMVGVEIDKHVVDIAQCYFNLASIKNLKIAIAEGSQYVINKAAQKRPQRYDLIIVDVYLGRTMPRQFRTKKFFRCLEKLLNKNGLIIFNHLFFKHHKKGAQQFISALEAVYPHITLQRTASNLLIFASPRTA